jgi:hypothetical protein
MTDTVGLRVGAITVVAGWPTLALFSANECSLANILLDYVNAE